MSETKEVQVSLCAYTKILCHVMQYPHTAVNGVLLTSEGDGEVPEEGEEGEAVDIVDCVPLFHYCLPLSPMFTVALTQIEEWASNKGLRICGYYHANEFCNDNDVGPIAGRIAEKIVDNCEGGCLLMVQNDKLGHIKSEIPLKAYFPSRVNDRVDWKASGAPTLQYGEAGLSIGPEIVKSKLQRSIVDMDTHYDDVKLHWDNRALSQVVSLFAEQITRVAIA